MRFFAWSIDLVMSFRNLNCHEGKNLTDLSNYIFNYRNGSDLLSDLLLMQICIYQNPISSFPLTCHLRVLKGTYDGYYNLISCDLFSSFFFLFSVNFFIDFETGHISRSVKKFFTFQIMVQA